MGRCRDFDALSEAQVATGRTLGRRVPAETGFRPASAQSMTALIEAIERVAEAATGERSYLPPCPPAADEGRARRSG